MDAHAHQQRANELESVERMEVPTRVLTADGMRLFLIRRTVMEMLRDRGYEVTDVELHRSPEQFCASFGEAPSRDTLNFCTGKRLNLDDRICVIFPKIEAVMKEKVTVATVKQCAEAMKVNRTKRGILVAHKALTPFASKSVDQICNTYKLEVFLEAELLVNLMDSVSVPKHEVLSPEETKAIMKKYSVDLSKNQVIFIGGIETSGNSGRLPPRYLDHRSFRSEINRQLPQLSQTDPVARYLGLGKGQVIKIIRHEALDALPAEEGTRAAEKATPQRRSIVYRVVT